MKKIVFLTTIFPMKEKYLIDFFDSLLVQSYKNFDIVVVNDGYRNFDILLKKYNKLNVIELKYSNTPAKNREYGINYVISKGYDILIFGDSDDYFSKNRVEKSVELLDNYDIVVNDLSLFNDNGIYEKLYFSNRIKNNSVVEYDFIKDKNIFGLSNTAIKLNILGNKIIFDKDIVAVDWFLYKKLLKDRYMAFFTNKIITYYRQYNNNIIGLNNQNGVYPLWWEKI